MKVKRPLRVVSVRESVADSAAGSISGNVAANVHAVRADQTESKLPRQQRTDPARPAAALSMSERLFRHAAWKRRSLSALSPTASNSSTTIVGFAGVQ